MTVDEVRIAFKIGVDKTGSLSTPSFDDLEIEYWINHAIITYIKSNYSGSKNSPSFEQNERTRSNLRNLIVDYNLEEKNNIIELSNLPHRLNNAQVFELPNNDNNNDEYFYIVNEYCYLKNLGNKCSINERLRYNVKPITHDQIDSKLLDPFSMHNAKSLYAEPISLLHGNYEIIITDGTYKVEEYWITYIRQPKRFSFSPIGIPIDLPEHTHIEVVDLAVNQVLENIGSPRWKTNQYLITNN